MFLITFNKLLLSYCGNVSNFNTKQKVTSRILAIKCGKLDTIYRSYAECCGEKLLFSEVRKMMTMN